MYICMYVYIHIYIYIYIHTYIHIFFSEVTYSKKSIDFVHIDFDSDGITSHIIKLKHSLC